jgi:hypothetical protein
MGDFSEIFPAQYFLFRRGFCGKRNEEDSWELLISLGKDEADKLQQGQKIQIGVISFVDEPIIVTLQAVKDDRRRGRSK